MKQKLQTSLKLKYESFTNGGTVKLVPLGGRFRVRSYSKSTRYALALLIAAES